MVNVEKLSENRVKLTITVSAEEFDAALDKAFEKVVKDVKVDGFRPGKMPKSIFISRFGYEALYNDGIEFAFQATYPNAIREAGVYPTCDPKVDLVDFDQIKKGNSFDYTAEFDIWPELHLGEYKGLEVKPLSTRVVKKDVEEFINNVLKNKVENVVKEGAAEKGDTVTIDFEGFVDGVAFEGGKAEKYTLELGSNSFIPGFEDQLVGTKAGESKDVVVTFPENYHEGLSGKEATFKCLVHEVKNKVTPELTDEFVKELEIEGVDTVEKYQDYAKEQVKKQKEAKSKEQFERDCIEAVCNNSYAEFPQSLITNAVNQQVAGLEQQAKQYKIAPEVLLQYMGCPSMDEFKKTTEEQIKKQYLQELIFDEIIKKENIEVTPEEIEAKYLSVAGDESKVADVKKQYRESQVAYQLKVEKVIDLIKANVASTK